MIKSTQEDLLHLSSSFSKQLKRRFGKGPETCYVISEDTRLYIYMRNFMTPAEAVLINEQELNLATNFRSRVMNTVIKEFLPEVEKSLGKSFETFLYDWDYIGNKGFLLLENTEVTSSRNVETHFKESLFRIIEEVGSYYHKRPTHMNVVNFTHSMCVIESKAVFSQLERLVYEKGNVDFLFEQAREVKEGYLTYKRSFEEFFNRTISDVFILWDFEENRHYLIILFEKE